MDRLLVLWDWVLWAGSWAVWIAGTVFLLAIFGAIVEEILVRRKKGLGSSGTRSGNAENDESTSASTLHDGEEDLTWLADCLEEWEASQPKQDARPDWAKALGLEPPYTRQRLDAAYRVQARATHPDHGGSTAAFRAVQRAFEEGLRSV